MFWFWGKRKNKDAVDFATSGNLSAAKSLNCRQKLTSLDLRRAILDWRDQHIENIELHLNHELTELYTAMDEQAEKMSLKMSLRDLFMQKAFCKQHFEPIYNNWKDQQVTLLLNAAQVDLSSVFTHAFEFGEYKYELKYEESNTEYTNASIAVIASGLGVAGIPIVSTMSVTSAGGILGVFGATVIVWPVVIIGAAMVAGALAVGGRKAITLKPKAIARYQAGMRKAIEKQVLGYGDTKDSIRQRLQSKIEETAQNILIEIGQC